MADITQAGPMICETRCSGWLGVIVTLILDLHEDLNGCADVVEHCETVQLQKPLSFFFELVLAESVDL